MLQHTSTGQPFTGRTSQLLIVSLLFCLFFSLLMSIMKGGDPTATLAVLGIMAVYIGSAELLGIFIVFAPISLLTDILFLAFHEHKGGRCYIDMFLDQSHSEYCMSCPKEHNRCMALESLSTSSA